MGHYASEIDPSWGQPSASEVILSKVEDERIRNLASALFEGSHSGSITAYTCIHVAEAIDGLIKARFEELMSPVSPTEA